MYMYMQYFLIIHCITFTCLILFYKLATVHMLAICIPGVLASGSTASIDGVMDPTYYKNAHSNSFVELSYNLNFSRVKILRIFV